MSREQLPDGAGVGVMELPQPAAVHAALRVTTERLAAEVAVPQHSPPDWSDFEWRTARAVAAMHGISGLLGSRLRWQGPGGWMEFLSEQREHIARRNLRIREFLARISELFESQGVPAQALKGAALCADGFYQRGERPMADLDLLVPPQHVERAAVVLEGLGLRESLRTVKHRVFVAHHTTQPARFGEHADNDMKVELHERICEPLPLRLVDISTLIFPLDMHPGLNPYPSRAALLAHLLLHAAGAMAHRTLRLVQLHDLALLARRLTEEDWTNVLSWEPWWAWPPLALAARYYGPLARHELMVSARAHCPAMLRRTCAGQTLCDVSLSRLWLEAFPGIEWARSIGEAISYMGRRVVPSAEDLAQRQFAVQTDPSLAVGEWGRLSQGRRIVRFVISRTPRPWPLYNVHAALTQRR
jgi:hypothetical protein